MPPDTTMSLKMPSQIYQNISKRISSKESKEGKSN